MVLESLVRSCLSVRALKWASEYYRKLDDTLIYLAGVILHPSHKWQRLETLWGIQIYVLGAKRERVVDKKHPYEEDDDEDSIISDNSGVLNTQTDFEGSKRTRRWIHEGKAKMKAFWESDYKSLEGSSLAGRIMRCSSRAETKKMLLPVTSTTSGANSSHSKLSYWIENRSRRPKLGET